MKNKFFGGSLVIATVLAGLTESAMAATVAVDTTDAVAQIQVGLAAVAALGAAYLAITVLKKLWSKLGG